MLGDENITKNNFNMGAHQYTQQAMTRIGISLHPQRVRSRQKHQNTPSVSNCDACGSFGMIRACSRPKIQRNKLSRERHNNTQSKQY